MNAGAPTADGLTQAERVFAALLAAPAVWVTVDATRGSVPRDPKTWMAVFPDRIYGSIGGGQVEYQAIAQARLRLTGAGGDAVVRYPLGPSLGQCCGGVMDLRFECVGEADIAALRQRIARSLDPVAVFGAGHVGQALVAVLGSLPFAVTWIDSRDEVFAPPLPAALRCEQSDPVHAAVADLPGGCAVLVMSFSHAEDLEIVAACLLRQRVRSDLHSIGLIGSKTKWARFRSRLAGRGFSQAELAQVQCPIGIAGIAGKEPEVIAVAVAAQLLRARAAQPFADAA